MPLPALLLPAPLHVSKLLGLELRLGRRAGAWRMGGGPLPGAGAPADLARSSSLWEVPV